MNKVGRILVAIILCPLALIPVMFVAGLVEDVTQSSETSIANAVSNLSLQRLFMKAFVVSAYGAFFSWIGAALIGVPTYNYFRRRGIATVGRCSLIGGLSGLLAGLALFHYLPIVGLMASCGVSVAAVFCLIAGRSDPGDHKSTA